MMSNRIIWLSAGVLGLGFWFACTSVSDEEWERYIQTGEEAYQQGRYTDAETSWLAALEQAKKFGDEDTRLATSLNNLALLYSEQGKYAEAEPLARRALEIWEEALGPEHPNVAKSLENYAALLREMDRNEEADRLEERARAYGMKNGEEVIELLKKAGANE